MNTHNLFFSSRLSLSNHPHESVRRPKPIFEGGEAERRQDGPCPFAEAARELVVKIHKRMEVRQGRGHSPSYSLYTCLTE